MKDVMGVIYVNNQEEGLQPLTRDRCVASVPFGGRYRLIDFILSSMVNSGIFNISVFTVRKYRSLMDHLETGKAWDLNRKHDGLFILPPQTHYHSAEFQGALQSFNQHLDYFHRSKQNYVVISGSNLVCNLDLSYVVSFHRQSDADITLLYKEVENGQEDFAGCARVITGKEEPAGIGQRVEDILSGTDPMPGEKAALCVYVMRKALLLELIQQCSEAGRFHLLDDGIISNLPSLKVCAYPVDGFISMISSIDLFYRRSMDLLQPINWGKLFFQPGLIYTKVKDEPPTRYTEDARVKNSLLANGCIVEGCVENSVLFRGVKINKGAHVKDSIIMQRCVVGENARVENAILDKEAAVSPNKIFRGEVQSPVVLEKRKTV